MSHFFDLLISFKHMPSSNSFFHVIPTVTVIVSVSCLLPYHAHASANPTQMIEEFLDGHNAARRAVGVPPLSWDKTLATYARVYSNQRRRDCKLIHSPGYAFGENLFWGMGRRWTAKDATAAWVAEKQWYWYDTNSCTGQECSHYTQVVWRTTRQVGCAKIICKSGDTFITCEYYPLGNYIGQRPYPKKMLP